ncbi:metallo-beta-lactamase domain-containing protein 1 isoform X2 [Rhineura floridana]|uniref:metallo-beta-lactamase domain-containing protein 1 isoform X2 n=1 Tax=Rhineura floridana TaxID=261503 RepID=UPI002AC83CFB|nr:metallo-beta-lactamase domain-containing protein 1 isoform X2 [Rhineura floridana]
MGYGRGGGGLALGCRPGPARSSRRRHSHRAAECGSCLEDKVLVPAVHIQATGRHGCCGNRCGMFLSVLLAAVGAGGAVYAITISSLGLAHGPLCRYLNNRTLEWGRPFEKSLEKFNKDNYLFDSNLWDICLDPPGVTRFNVILFSLILGSGLLELGLCLIQVFNGLFGCMCGTCNNKTRKTAVQTYN